NAGPGGTHADHALLGDEPTLETPWLYDWLRRPWRTQAAVRRALRLYSPTPTGYPGNDDLGTLSAWYVFGALGMYPAQPGTGTLALATPQFPRAEVRLAHGRSLTILAPGGRPYVSSLKLNGHPHERPWASYCEIEGGGTLAFTTSGHATRWGQRGQLPPSYGPGSPAPKSRCSP
ncbi:MAG: glycoside hydrolase family 92 protein, partial [Actinobacteria bacterium]|nr:glycoside hydrolase family 92 protein [Actinomycetota bacterium]